MSGKNIFCVDLEDWYHQNLLSSVDNPEKRVVQNTERLLEMFRESDTRATFFTVGQLADELSGLLQTIQREGHEIACHGYNHAIIYNQTPAEFEDDLRRAIDAIGTVCGMRPKGYRAPSWSITERSLWALDIIKKLGFSYDSSIFPVKNFLYGIPDSPRFAHERDTEHGKLLEVPPSTFTVFGTGMGFSGGFYLRALPGFVVKRITRNINADGNPVVYYLHPHEIDANTPNLAANFRDRLITGYGKRGCARKLASILNKFDFTSIENYYNL